MTSPSLTEQLANIPILYVLYFVIAVTVLRLAFVRAQTPGSRGVAEFLESAIIAVVLVFMILRPFVVQAYYIPSPSMVPTLMGKGGSGDRILVNKFLYRVSQPQHDDVVVFIPPPLATEGTPEESTGGVPVNFIKRLIARPGDTLVVHAGRVYVNGTEFDHGTVRKALMDAHVIQTQESDDPNDPQADHHVKFTAQGVVADGKLVPNTQLAQALTDQPSEQVKIVPGETILNGKLLNEPFTAEDPDYDLRIYKGESLKYDNNGNWRLDGQPITKSEYDADMASPNEPIPPHEYFMMGDNRNDSKDSTEWGPLEENRIVGKAQFIFWPLNRIRAIH